MCPVVTRSPTPTAAAESAAAAITTRARPGLLFAFAAAAASWALADTIPEAVVLAPDTAAAGVFTAAEGWTEPARAGVPVMVGVRCDIISSRATREGPAPKTARYASHSASRIGGGVGPAVDLVEREPAVDDLRDGAAGRRARDVASEPRALGRGHHEQVRGVLSRVHELPR